MKTSNKILGAALLLAALTLPTALIAQQAQDIAVVYKLLQDKRLQWNSATTFANLGQRLASGDAVITSANTRAAIRFTDDGSVVRLEPSSQLQITGPGVDRNALVKTVNLELGDLWASVTRQSERNFQVRTPAGVAAVKGTQFIVSVSAEQTTTVITLDGVVEFFNNVSTVDVEAGSTLQVVNANTAPVVRETTESDLTEMTQLLADVNSDSSDRVQVEIKLQNAEGQERTMLLELSREEVRALLGGGL